jgi:predicted oxidoreductase
MTVIDDIHSSPGAIPTVTLNDEAKMPVLGLGVAKLCDAGMIQSREQGHVRSIGVSNFTEEHLSTVIEKTSQVPAVNQIELHPRLNQAELRLAHTEHDVVTQAYSPLGVGRFDR